MTRLCFGILVLVLLAGCTSKPQPGDADKGHAVFAANCLVCHYTNTYETKMGPGLKDLFKLDRLQSGKTVTEASVRAQVAKGSRNMPPFETKLDAQDIADLLAFLKTL